MKKSIFSAIAAIAFGLLVSSCNSDNVALDATNDPTVAVQLSAARVAAATDSVTKQKCKGNLTPLAAADLPAAITTYIGANYAGSEIQFAGKDASGLFVVGLKLADATHKGLLFNADGTFNKALDRYPRGAKLTSVAIADLPATIKGYITTNYAGATISKAGKNTDGVYHVAITLADGSMKVIVFNADNSFKEEKVKGDHPEKNGKGKGR
jgi:hypothetical protein